MHLLTFQLLLQTRNLRETHHHNLFNFVFGVASASAQTFVEYTAKFMCGTATATSTPMVQPGTYSTSVNIHNPHDTVFSKQTSNTFAKNAGPDIES